MQSLLLVDRKRGRPILKVVGGRIGGKVGGVKCGCHLEPLSRPAVGTAARPVSAPGGGIGGSGGGMGKSLGIKTGGIYRKGVPCGSGALIQGKEEKPEGFGKVICFPEKIV